MSGATSDSHSPNAAGRVAVRRHDERRDGGVVAGHGRRAVVRLPAEVLEADVLGPQVRGYLPDALLAVLDVVLLVIVHLKKPQSALSVRCPGIKNHGGMVEADLAFLNGLVRFDQ